MSNAQTNSVREIPTESFPLVARQVDEWERCKNHPTFLGRFEMQRGDFGDFAGYLKPETPRGTVYVLGWLFGREAERPMT